MLLLHSRSGEICRAPEDLGGNALPPDLVWIDLLKPSPEEVAFVERATGLELPNFEALSEIESSSRLRAVNGALFLSAPLVYRSDADDPQATPVGFILTPEHFITVRFETPTAFTTAAQIPSPTPHDAFAGLLEATLGMINIDQNNIIKVLTIVSVVGVPPTLVASMYGMNFHNMPELDWAWGYPYGLALIALSAITPLLWFRWRGWF